mgnify:CR=1 FL=1
MGLHGAAIDVPAELAAQRIASRANGDSVYGTGVPAVDAAATVHGNGNGNGHSQYGGSQARSVAATPRGGGAAAGAGGGAFDPHDAHQPHPPHMGSLKAAVMKSLRSARHGHGHGHDRARLDQAVRVRA